MSASTLITDYLKIFAGTPTGVPPVNTAVAAFGWDDTNKLLYAYSWSASAWKLVGGSGGSGPISPYYDPTALALTKPAAAGFTVVKNTSQGSAGSLADLASRGVALVATQNTSAADNLILAEQNVPSTTAFTLIAALHWSPLYNFQAVGVEVRDTSGKMVSWNITTRVANFYAQQVAYQTFGSINSANIPTIIRAAQTNGPLWLKLQLTSGNFVFYISHDGENWIEFHTVSATAFIGTPQSCGLYADCNGSNTYDKVVLDCFSWTLTTP